MRRGHAGPFAHNLPQLWVNGGTVQRKSIGAMGSRRARLTRAAGPGLGSAALVEGQTVAFWWAGFAPAVVIPAVIGEGLKPLTIRYTPSENSQTAIGIAAMPGLQGHPLPHAEQHGEVGGEQ